MDRRSFLHVASASAVLGTSQVTTQAKPQEDLPNYRIVSAYKATGDGMPGRYPGRVVAVKSDKSIDTQTLKVNVPIITEMMKQGMQTLTGKPDLREAWSSFFGPCDVVGIKTNCSGAPKVNSSPEVIAEITRNLIAVGVQPSNIYIYERFPDQMATVGYQNYVPKGVNVWAAEEFRRSIANYDPKTYVEVDFFGEEDTRSNMIRLVTEKFTKIINVPNMKDHGAAGVTGCLKNIAYGNFSNVARSHFKSKTNTLSFIGTLASVEPLRSKTVLNIMDGLKGVWHGGPFVQADRFRFFPKEMFFGTDPVAMDRLMMDVVENERKKQNAPSVWDRSSDHVKVVKQPDPNFNAFIREPGHIEFATKLGLGTYDISKIKQQSLQV
jgi:uncharacterized protein (DUF362 family)